MTEAPPRVDDEIEVTLTGMAHGGEAVGRAADGRVVFVAGGIPPETVKARLSEVHGRFARGVLAGRPVSPSGDRVEPSCPYYGDWPARGHEAWCGACQWQHLSYEAQRRFKSATLRDTLTRIGRLDDPPVRPTIGMEHPWRYRNQVRLVACEGGLGYRARGTSDVVPVEHCPVAHPLVESLLGAVGELPHGLEVTLRAGTRTGQRMIVLHAAADDIGGVDADTEASVALVDDAGDAVTVSGEAFLVEKVAETPFLIPPGGFFQANTAMTDTLVALVREAVGTRVRRLVDVHSGVGLFAVLLSDLGDEVFAIERHGPSVAAAVENAAGLHHLSLIEATAAEGLAHLDMALDVVLLDPPGEGIDPPSMQLLAQRAPHTIVYVSCEPATLARDAKQLVAAGWRLQSSQPVDMFPHTYHVESVNVFRR